MDAYTFALALGGAGLVAMAAGGFASHGHPGGGEAGTGHAGDGHAGAHAGDHAGAPAHHGHDAGLHHLSARAHAAHTPGGMVRSALLTLMSPRVVFSLFVGFGLTGVAVRHLLAGPAQLGLAVIGAIAFEALLVGPTWRYLFRFASVPAASLEGALMSEAHAASGFDTNGQGLVALEVDGQIVQCLGTLRADDRALGVHVRAGDRLRVEDVDATRNRCTVAFVSREIAAS